MKTCGGFLARIGAGALACGFAAWSVVAVPAAADSWTATGDLTRNAYRHAAVVLADGRALIVGGMDETGITGRADLYSPASGTWSRAASMLKPRYGMAVEPLPDGSVLAAAGVGDVAERFTSEIYDPVRDRWTLTGRMLAPLALGASVRLANGDVLVIGGETAIAGPLTLIQRYDWRHGTWSAAGSLLHARYYHTATLLGDGRVLVVGGIGLHRQAVRDAELFDPATGSATRLNGPFMARYYHSAIALDDGRVLVAGGAQPAGCLNLQDLATDPFVLLECSRSIRTAEVFDPADGAWTQAGSMLAERFFFASAKLRDGRVLAAGGISEPVAGALTRLDTAESWSPVTGLWTSLPDMSAIRESPAAVLLRNGRILVAGGRTRSCQLLGTGAP